MSLKVLAYYQVSNSRSDPLTVKTEMFLRQLDYLEDSGFRFISPDRLTSPIPSLEKFALLTFDHCFRSHYEVVLPLLKARGLPAVFSFATDSIGKEGMLGFEEIGFLARSGFKIGSHTLSHPYLTRLPLAQAKKEIEYSKKVLEDRLSVAVDFFSYPYGDSNEEVIDLVRASGYKLSFLTRPWWKKEVLSSFIIPRQGIYYGTSFFLFQLKLFR